jgi:nucleoside-diphosphate kinase
MVWEGANAIESIRQIGGNKHNPMECPPGTIRRDFSTDSVPLANIENRAVRLLIHASDSIESANKELKLWFPERNYQNVLVDS